MTDQRSDKLKSVEASLAEALSRERSLAESNALITELRSQELGKIGKWFGSRENAALYIAGAVVILGFMFGLIVILIKGDMVGDVFKFVAAASMAALGFIGGLLAK